MLKSRLTLILLAVILLVPMIGVTAQEGAPIAWPDLGGRELRVAVENAYPPYNSIDADGNGVGWDYDTFNAICELLNCTPVYVETAWDGMLAAIGAGNADFDVAADGITYTAERDEAVDFSQLYQAYDEVLLVRANEDRFATPDELIALGDFMVATQTGTTNALTAEALFGTDHVLTLGDFGAAVQSLLQDDADAVVIDRPAAQGFIDNQEGLKIVGASLAGMEGLAFAFPSGSDLVYPINAAMSALQASGKWNEIYNTWFGEAAAEATG